MAHYAVTGAAGGIGAALCRMLRADGHKVTGFDLAAGDGVYPLDLSDPASIAAVAGAHGPFDGLCNNAGLPPRAGNAAQVLVVNFLGTRAFTEAMLHQMAPGASVVNVASRAGQFWREGAAQAARLAALTQSDDLAAFAEAEGIDATRAYNLSKEALILWTFANSERLAAQGLRINAVSPAAVDTAILGDFTQAFGGKVERNLARAGRAGAPEEIAAVAAFLLSPRSSWIKGADIPVDGGMGAYALSDAMGLRADFGPS
ncbi:MAG: SDR family oxidoreductase [Pseudomonadota bacterium]